MARNPTLLAAILIAVVFAVSTAQARLGWTLDEREDSGAVNAAKDAGTATPTAPQIVAAPTPAGSLPTNVVAVITSNRWSDDVLIVTGTLTNTSAVPVLITAIDAKGFNQDQKMVSEGSNFTIVHNDLAPGAVVNFKVALKDDTKQVRFVKVLPSWFAADDRAVPTPESGQ